jgi:hypothetical protein
VQQSEALKKEAILKAVLDGITQHDCEALVSVPCNGWNVSKSEDFPPDNPLQSF